MPSRGEDSGAGFKYREHLTDLLFVVLLVFASTECRLTDLEYHPARVSHDEGNNGKIVLQILEGRSEDFVLTEIEPGEEAATFHLQALSMGHFGRNLWAFRFPTAFVTSLLPPLAYVLMRRFVGPAAALLSALLLCFNVVHLGYSRIGNSIGYVPTALAVTLYFLHASLLGLRPFQFLGLGLGMALGIHTYPAFRLVPVLVAGALLGLLLVVGWKQKRRVLGGLLLAFAVLALAFAPLVLQGDQAMAAYLFKFQDGLGASTPIQERLDRAVEIAPIVVQQVLGLNPSSDYAQIYPDLVGAGALLALVMLLWTWCGTWRRRWQGAADDPGPFLGLREFQAWRNPSGPLFLALLLGLMIIPPFVVGYDPFSSRRYILGLLPAHLLAAVAFESLSSRSRPFWNQREVWRGAFLGLVCFAATEEMFYGADEVFQLTAGKAAPPRLRTLATARRLTGDRRLVVPIEPLLYPDVPLESPPPEVSFLLDLYPRSDLAKGLNPYPLGPPGPDLSFLLPGASWTSLLQEVHPSGKVSVWEDPGRGASIQVYTVPGLDAWRHRGLQFTSLGPDGESSTTRVAGLELPGGLSSEIQHGTWSGSIYIPQSGRWTLTLRGPGVLSLELSGRQEASNSGAASLEGPLAEGWHLLRVSSQSAEPGWKAPVLLWKASLIPDGAVSSYFGDPAAVKSPVPVPAACYIAGDPVRPGLRARRTARQRMKLSNRGFLELRLGDQEPERLNSVVMQLTARLLGSGIEFSQEAIRTQLDVCPNLKGGDFIDPMQLNVTRSPDGAILIADAPGQRLHLIAAGGGDCQELDMPGTDQSASTVTYDPVRRLFWVSNSEAGTLRRIETGGTELSRWMLPGAGAICALPDGRVACVLADLGGISILDPRGKERDFWRATEVDSRSRMACDRAGRILVSTRGGRILGLTSEGEVFLTWKPFAPQTLRDGPVAITALVGLTGGGFSAVGEWLDRRVEAMAFRLSPES